MSPFVTSSHPWHQVMTQNMATTEGFDLTRCSQLTDSALGHLDRMTGLKVLHLSHCARISDTGLLGVRSMFAKLQVLCVEGLSLVSDAGLAQFAEKCRHLQVFCVNQCPNVSHETLVPIARQNKFLHTLQLGGTNVQDEALSLICAAIQEGGCGETLTALDISHCAELTDLGVCCVAEVCPQLRSLRMAGLSRVSDRGVRAVCANCWGLEHLDVEDIFLLRDDAFWFSASYDGRRAANENMLVSLKHLNLSDCANLTDRGVEGLAERCRQMDVLVLRGCDKITDTALRHLGDPSISTASSASMSDTIHSLNLSYSTGITGPGVLALLPSCACLEELDLSGLANFVNDAFVQTMGRSCPTLQKLTLQKCLLLSDAALCSLAENLWLEHLDVTGCHKLTDAGIEVLSEACNGLRSLALRRLKRVSDAAVFCVLRNCKGLQRLDVRDCPLVSAACAEEARSSKPTLAVLA
jgi:hypothetical protein